MRGSSTCAAGRSCGSFARRPRRATRKGCADSPVRCAWTQACTEAHFASFTGGQTIISKDARGQRRSTGGEEIVDAFELTVSGVGRSAGLSELSNARLEFEKNAVVVLTGLGRQASKQRGFLLAKPIEIEIYCIGEAREDGSFDYGAIVNADTREQVWQLTYANSEPAGGAAKNRLVRKTLALPAGKYVRLVHHRRHARSARLE